MSRLPTVAIIGRPNTGKSTLFNRMLGEFRAIVSDVPGTTRDRVASQIDGDTVDYLLVDTAGIGGGTEDKELEADVTAQSLLAMEFADLILFTINAREEVTGSDRKVIDMLRKKRKRHVPVLVVATKCDSDQVGNERMSDLLELGIGDAILPVSAAHNVGISELEETIEAHLKKLHFGKYEREDTGDAPRIAIIGKPNVGKSSIINALMSDPQRAAAGRIVSDIPGTTRDASDTVIKHEGQSYVFVDTAGLRRKSRIESDIEKSSALRSIQALYDADIVAIVLDSAEAVSQQDKRIARMAMEQGRGLILILNKVDLLNAEQKGDLLRSIRRELHFCDFAPMMTVSATTRENLVKLFPLFRQVSDNLRRRVPQRDLQTWYQNAVQQLPAHTLSRGKYVVQADAVPPTFVLFVPNPRRVVRSQTKFLEHSLRDIFAFDGVPLRFVLKEK